MKFKDGMAATTLCVFLLAPLTAEAIVGWTPTVQTIHPTKQQSNTQQPKKHIIHPQFGKIFISK